MNDTNYATVRLQFFKDLYPQSRYNIYEEFLGVHKYDQFNHGEESIVFNMMVQEAGLHALKNLIVSFVELQKNWDEYIVLSKVEL